MAYVPQIPLANKKLSQSQPQIYNNFVSIGNMLTPDLGTIKFPVQAAAQNTAAGEVSIYSKLGTGVPAIQSLFWREANNNVPGTGEHDMTSCRPTATGWSKLPSGIMIQWGENATNNGPVAVVFAPDFTTVFTAFCTQKVANTGQFDAFTISNLNVHGFTAFSHAIGGNQAPSSAGFYWFAIGI